MVIDPFQDSNQFSIPGLNQMAILGLKLLGSEMVDDSVEKNRFGIWEWVFTFGATPPAFPQSPSILTSACFLAAFFATGGLPTHGPVPRKPQS